MSVTFPLPCDAPDGWMEQQIVSANGTDAGMPANYSMNYIGQAINDAQQAANQLNTTLTGHIGSGGTAHANATESVAGFMSAADKTKLDATNSQSLTTNGYQKLPGGLILQWGTYPNPAGGSGTGSTISFPIVFPNACLNVTATMGYNSPLGSNQQATCAILAISTSTVSIGWEQYPGSGGNPTNVRWFAIGY